MTVVITSAVKIILVLLLFHKPFISEGRIVSETCFQKVDGSRCHSPLHPWQHDGVCIYNPKTKKGRCIAPDTHRFKLSLVARYRSLSIRDRGGTPVKNMYIRGSGPGLSWEKPLKMDKSAKAIDIWTAHLSYRVDSDGLPCLLSSHCSLNQQALEFRIYKDELGQKPMKGPNFYIPLPASQSLHGAISFLQPKLTVYPWFHKKKVTSKSFEFFMSSHLLGKKEPVNCTLLYPPSFKENVRKHYPLVIILGINGYYKPLLEHLFVHEASIEEVIILMIDSPSEVKRNKKILLPFKSSVEFQCKVGDQCDDCQTCWAQKRVEPCDKDEFIGKSKRCLVTRYLKGMAEPFMDSIQHELVVKVQEMTANRLKYDPPRQRITLMGHTDMAVMVFHAALTKPEIFGNVACFSPRFVSPFTPLFIHPFILYVLSFVHLFIHPSFFPIIHIFSRFFQPLNDRYQTSSMIFDAIIKQGQKVKFNHGLQALHSTQKYYFDHGENDDFFFPLANAIQTTNDVIKKLKEVLYLEEHTNILEFTIPKEKLSYMTQSPPDLISRLKFPLTIFHRANGGPDKEYVRSIKVSEEFIAERQSAIIQSNPDTTDNSDTGSILDSSTVNDTKGNTDKGFFGDRIMADDDNDDGYCTPQCNDKAGVPLGVFLGSVGKHLLIVLFIHKIQDYYL